MLLGDNEVAVIDDVELNTQCVEILGGQVSMQFDCDSILRYLSLHVKHLEKYFAFEVEIVDDSKQYRVFKCANTASVARIEMHECLLPVSVKLGWNFLNLDLEDLCQRAFGTNYLSTTQVRVYGNCRLLHVYFQDQLYSDAELPEHLKVIKTQTQ